MDQPREQDDAYPASRQEPVPDTPESATGMFSTPVRSPVAAASEDVWQQLPAGERKTADPFAPGHIESPSELPARATPPAPRSAPGEFTQFFQTLGTPSSPSAEVAPPRAETTPAEARPQAPGEFTQIFLEVPKRPSYPVTPDTGTQDFPVPDTGSRGATPETDRNGQRPLPVWTDNFAPSHNADQPQTPGEFTRLMRSITDPAKQNPAGSLPAIESESPRAPMRGFSSPGLNDSASGTAEFTRAFAPDAASSAPPVLSSASAPLPASFTAPQEPRGGFDWEFPNFQSISPPRDPDAALPSAPLSGQQGDQQGGGFTRLFQALSEAGTLAQGDVLSITPEPRTEFPPAIPSLSAGPGEFTTLMQALSGNAAPDAAGGTAPLPGIRPPAAPAQQPAPVAGPGEFTRIISRPGKEESVSAPPSAAAPAKPAFPQFSGMPPVPHLPVMPAAAAPPSMQPVLPQAPPLQAPAAPKGKLQQYLPILLVINAFVLLVLILLVIFALRHH